MWIHNIVTVLNATELYTETCEYGKFHAMYIVHNLEKRVM